MKEKLNKYSLTEQHIQQKRLNKSETKSRKRDSISLVTVTEVHQFYYQIN